jgi:hypothetical protein
MLLKLHYTESIQHETGAAFIRGSAPGIWFKELNRWSMGIQELECYLVPQSLHNLQPAGLFVIFRNAPDPKSLDLMEPYGLIADRLFVPVNALLTPVTGADELQNLLLWERQLFHPTIGLVGFSPSDKLDLSQLLECGQPAGKKWNLAKPGIPAKNKLQQIRVQQPSLEDVMESFKELVDPKSLEQLMNKEEDKSMLKDLFQNLQQNSLNTALSALEKLKEAWASGNNDENKQNYTGLSSGMLDKLENWIKENLADLEKKRNNEIKRLLNMFDENTDEALKYAIPLDSPYLNRGTTDPSARLGAHTTDFDLGKLGGGRQTDSWNVHANYYNDLRNKYQRAAQKEIEAKDFKKAAYIYAHLLGDFQSAANVLEQGKHYREAAVLYKDHLHNLPAAAGCLERGGLLLESIELYDRLHKYEKVGDLYQKMEQPENAEKYYEQSIEQLLANKDYLDASRIMQEKIHNPERAMQTLFKGWTDSRQSETCLKQYVSMQYEKDAAEAISGLQDIFANHTPRFKKNQFLNVLTYMNEQKNDPELLDTSRNMAYEIISEELENGKLSNLPALKKFLPQDPLIASDCSRFTARSSVQPVEPSAADETLQLDKGVKWISAVIHRNQFLVLGLKNSRLQLARGNWYGNLEYYSWNDHIKATDYFMLIADPLRSNRVMLHTSGGIALEEKKLPKNKYFDDELQVYSPTWLSKGYAGISYNSQGGITALAATNHKLSLHYYTMDVYLQHTIDGHFEGKTPLLMPSHYMSEMIYRNGFYYTFQENLLLKISEKGLIHHTDVQAIISKFAASTHYAKFRIALATDLGCLLMRQVGGELKPGNDFFAQDIDAVDIRFVSANHLVVAAKDKAVVYEIIEDTVKAGQTIESHSPIVAILPTADRHQIAVLEEKGRLSIHQVVQA